MLAYRERRAVALSHLARGLMRQGDRENAQARFDESIQLLEQLITEQPQNPAYPFDQAYVDQWNGVLLLEIDPEQARVKLESAIKRWQTVNSKFRQRVTRTN